MKGGFGCSPCCGGGNCTFTEAGSDAVDSNYWSAQGFITPSGGLTLSSVTVYIDSTAGTKQPTVAQMAVELYSSINSEYPNASILSLTAPAAIADTMTWTAPDEPLAGNTLYYIVMRLTAVNKITYWRYEYASEGCPQGPPSNYSSDGGANWFPPSYGSPYMMDIN